MEEKLESMIFDLVGRIDKALLEDDLEMSSLRQELQSSNVELSLLRKKMSDLQVEIDLTISQLHQSQQELNRYYVLCQKQSAMLSVSDEIHARSFALIAGSYK